MKCREDMTLVDPRYLFGAQMTGNYLHAMGLRPILVGGAGVQAQILASDGKQGARDIRTIPQVSAQERYLRPTNDYDFACRGEPRMAREALRALAAEGDIGCGDDVYRFQLVRDGDRRPVLAIESTHSDQPLVVTLNLAYNGSDFRLGAAAYDRTLELGWERPESRCRIRNGALSSEILTAVPAHLVAAKAHRYAEKDREDIPGLYAALRRDGRAFDWKELGVLASMEPKTDRELILERVKRLVEL